ncbi:hypothetical protein LX16_1898 [Stackebrandtia albiflava]|uniref:LemA protein n=1 Tax=Stackebrandtia albiflava TaxID=406432 RepID=A0A562VE64_9ACTN|nr:hypothetical protein [Stackebrandtia albiflava]TWJ16173.1 hypothetical protein LX16_1898 [Stackebrandtia albiflava]
MWWLVVVVVVVAVLGTYLTWTATRVERLHARAVDADAALSGKLDIRAKTALALADTEAPRLGRHAEALRAAGHASLDSLPEERETAENDLTRVLRELPLPPDDPALEEVRRVNRRVAIARQVHTDVVRDAVATRHRWVVRLFGLTRRLPRPRYFNMDNPD